MSAKDMRPIFHPVHYLANSFVLLGPGEPQLADGYFSWVHPTACGGIHGKGVARAVDMLFQKIEKEGFC